MEPWISHTKINCKIKLVLEKYQICWRNLRNPWVRVLRNSSTAMMHFRLSFHGQAFDDAWAFRSCSFKELKQKTKRENIYVKKKEIKKDRKKINKERKKWSNKERKKERKKERQKERKERKKERKNERTNERKKERRKERKKQRQATDRNNKRTKQRNRERNK